MLNSEIVNLKVMNTFKKRKSGCRLTIIIFIVAVLSMLSLAVNPANSQDKTVPTDMLHGYGFLVDII